MGDKIPKFPNSVRVSAEVENQIRDYVARYPPYSDFNYVSLYNWDLANNTNVSMLKGNLVLSMVDYISNAEFFTFLGDKDLALTTKIVLDEAEKKRQPRTLRLVPETTALALKKMKRYGVKEDADNHDYILSLPELVAKQGPKFKNMRCETRGFENNYGGQATFKTLNIVDSNTRKDILDVFLYRENQKSYNDYNNELLAVKRSFDHGDKVQFYGLSLDGNLKAFAICEKISNKWSMGHFWKADTSYRGIYRYLLSRIADVLALEGFEYMNIQQDLGIEGLKTFKKHFCPIGHLKKYTVTDEA